MDEFSGAAPISHVAKIEKFLTKLILKTTIRVNSIGAGACTNLDWRLSISNVIYTQSKSKIIEIFEKRYIYPTLYILVHPCISNLRIWDFGSGPDRMSKFSRLRRAKICPNLKDSPLYIPPNPKNFRACGGLLNSISHCIDCVLTRCRRKNGCASSSRGKACRRRFFWDFEPQNVDF